MKAEISKEDAQRSLLHNQEESGKPQPDVQSANESPKKQVPKNIVTSWSDWAAKTKTTVNKEAKETTSTSQSNVKRLA